MLTNISTKRWCTSMLMSMMSITNIYTLSWILRGSPIHIRTVTRRCVTPIPITRMSTTATLISL